MPRLPSLWNPRRIGNPVCAAPMECRMCHSYHAAGARNGVPTLSTQPLRNAECATPTTSLNLGNSRRIGNPVCAAPSGEPKVPRLPRLWTPLQIGDPVCAALRECRQAMPATSLEPATDWHPCLRSPSECQSVTPATSLEPATDCQSCLRSPITPITSLKPATPCLRSPARVPNVHACHVSGARCRVATLSAQPLRSAEVPRLPRLWSPRRIGNPVCASREKCPNLMPATSLEPPTDWQPCLRSTSGVPKRHACRVSGGSDGLAILPAQCLRSAESVTRATTLELAKDCQSCLRSPSQCRMCHACRVFGVLDGLATLSAQPLGSAESATLATSVEHAKDWHPCLRSPAGAPKVLRLPRLWNPLQIGNPVCAALRECGKCYATLATSLEPAEE